MLLKKPRKPRRKKISIKKKASATVGQDGVPCKLHLKKPQKPQAKKIVAPTIVLLQQKSMPVVATPEGMRPPSFNSRSVLQGNNIKYSAFVLYFYDNLCTFVCGPCIILINCRCFHISSMNEEWEVEKGRQRKRIHGEAKEASSLEFTYRSIQYNSRMRDTGKEGCYNSTTTAKQQQHL